jgi:hypothetical protein
VAANEAQLFVHDDGEIVSYRVVPGSDNVLRDLPVKMESPLDTEAEETRIVLPSRSRLANEVRLRLAEERQPYAFSGSRDAFLARIAEIGLFSSSTSSIRHSDSEPPFCLPCVWFDSETAEDDGYTAAIRALAEGGMFPASNAQQRGAEMEGELDVVLELTLGQWRYIGTWEQEGDYLAPEFFTFLESALADFNADLVLAELATDDQAHCMFICNREPYFQALLQGVLPAPFELLDPMDEEEEDGPESARFWKSPIRP